MTDTPKLRLGTRSSPLAMVQAREARSRICNALGWREHDVELVPVLASGDKVLDRPLAEIGGKALWTKELDHWLDEGLIDVSVHSMKDVETLRPGNLAIGAILPRADVRDVLLGAASLDALPRGARIGTSAPRRAAQMLHVRPDCRIVPFRGNVATRLGKLASGDADATLLAAAGLDRLGQEIGCKLDPGQWLPAPAQGAIGLECRSDDEKTRAILALLDHAPSRAQVMAERGLLLALGGNCHSSIGLLCTGNGAKLAMRAALFSPDGADRVEASREFAADDMRAMPDFARQLLDLAGPAIRAHFSGAA